MNSLKARIQEIERDLSQSEKGAAAMTTPSASKVAPPPLPRAASWEEWESGRAARRELSRKITGGKILRRARGNPRKDRLLQSLNQGERGLLSLLNRPRPRPSSPPATGTDFTRAPALSR